MVRKRSARNRFEVDLLPPFGKSEVYVVGSAAKLAAGIVAAGIGIGFAKKISE